MNIGKDLRILVGKLETVGYHPWIEKRDIGSINGGLGW